MTGVNAPGHGFMSIESSVENNDHSPCLLHLTFVVTQVLFFDVLEGESVGLNGVCLDQLTRAFFAPSVSEIGSSKL